MFQPFDPPMGANHPDATFGLMAWTSAGASYRLFYKDDMARALLAAIAASAMLKTDAFVTQLSMAVLASLRITGVGGFGPQRADFADVQKKGWCSYYTNDYRGQPDMYSPHYQSWLWAVYLWAYHQSGHAPLYERAHNAIAEMMSHYPARWVPTQNGITMQRARMLLPLAWLVRVNGSAEHRGWLRTVADGLLARQAACGALREEVSAKGWAAATRVPNNTNYGTFEAPLNQENDDPVSDLLYTTNFAIIGLHETAAALAPYGEGDKYAAAEDALATFLVRIQTDASFAAGAPGAARPELDGAFFRAFDFEKWEVWASDADAGWGAWSVETGWTAPWIHLSLGLRHANTSLWEVGAGGVDAAPAFEEWLPFFFPEGACA
jgi:hypothetical protein